MTFAKHTLFLGGILLLVLKGYGQQVTPNSVWVADEGNGTYKNPVLNADYSDPDAIRVGKDYYLVASSFNCSPGLPILHSYDLVNWKIINYAIDQQEPKAVYDAPQHGKGVWAPAIRYHNGEYYIFYPDPDYGIYMLKAKNPAGKWSKPTLILKGKGIIDPCPLWDTDGNAYLITAWAGSRAGVNSILTLFQMSADGSHILDKGRHVYDGHDNNHTTEGPKLYKKDGFYYIFAPAGGVATGWQLVLRSRSIYGPYEEKVVMDQGKTDVNGPHQGAWVKTRSGESWFLHFQDKGPYGRVLHLQPMVWKHNWPVIGRDDDGDGKGEPVASYRKPDVGRSYPIAVPTQNDEFNGIDLGKQWQWQANAQITWSALLPGSGHLRLFAYPQLKGSPNLWMTPNLLLQKIPAPAFNATTKVKYTIEWDAWHGKRAGLIVTGNDYSYIAISKDSLGYKVGQFVCQNAATGSKDSLVEEKRIPGPEVFLRVTFSPGAVCHFSYSIDEKSFTAIGKQFQATPDKWVGSKIGVFCISTLDERLGGYADFDWFRLFN